MIDALANYDTEAIRVVTPILKTALAISNVSPAELAKHANAHIRWLMGTETDDDCFPSIAGKNQINV